MDNHDKYDFIDGTSLYSLKTLFQTIEFLTYRDEQKVYREKLIKQFCDRMKEYPIDKDGTIYVWSNNRNIKYKYTGLVSCGGSHLILKPFKWTPPNKEEVKEETQEGIMEHPDKEAYKQVEEKVKQHIKEDKPPKKKSKPNYSDIKNSLHLSDDIPNFYRTLIYSLNGATVRKRVMVKEKELLALMKKLKALYREDIPTSLRREILPTIIRKIEKDNNWSKYSLSRDYETYKDLECSICSCITYRLFGVSTINTKHIYKDWSYDDNGKKCNERIREMDVYDIHGDLVKSEYKYFTDLFDLNHLTDNNKYYDWTYYSGGSKDGIKGGTVKLEFNTMKQMFDEIKKFSRQKHKKHTKIVLKKFGFDM